jgi:hypothetical protein
VLLKNCWLDFGGSSNVLKKRVLKIDNRYNVGATPTPTGLLSHPVYITTPNVPPTISCQSNPQHGQ